MPFCRNCGEELKEGASYCTSCGSPITVESPVYRRNTAQEWTVGRMVILSVGVIILRVSFGLLIGGGSINLMKQEFSDNEGYLLTRGFDLDVDSYAIVGSGIDIEWAPQTPTWLPRPGDFVTVKILARSNDPSKEVFIGVAQETYTGTYLNKVRYHEVKELSWTEAPWSNVPPEVTYTIHSGSSPTAPPTIHSWWVAHATGPGLQELVWKPEVGDYWVIIMNSDGSSELDLSVRLGVRMPILDIIGSALLAAGVITLVIGGAMIYLGVSRKG
jgi:hypothetical protein